MFLFRELPLNENVSICSSLKCVPGMGWIRARIISSKIALILFVI